VIVIAPEASGQRDEILALNREAFGGNDEAQIIEKLTEAGLVTASIVATSNSQVVGHILFSDLAVEVDGRKVAAVALKGLSGLCRYPDVFGIPDDAARQR